MVPSLTFVATANAVAYCGAAPAFADVEADTWCLSVDSVERLLSPQTKGIIPVHLYGHPCDMGPLLELARAKGLWVVEDCAEALGATYDGRPVGSFGTLSTFSFYGNKMVTTGEGGMLLARDVRLLRRAQDLRDYDERRTFRTRFNYKMTDFQAALGLSQLRQLPVFLAKRRALADRYNQELRGLLLAGPFVPADRDHIFYRYVVRVGRGLETMLSRLERAGVSARRPVFRPLHRYLKLAGFPGTEEAWRTALSLPIYPTLKGDIERVIGAVRRLFLGQAGGLDKKIVRARG
jgi:dTDP-4-amino-4,6-dideoxygalactose transaminase